MPVIDADTHVDETEATWEYIDDPALRPDTVCPSNPDPKLPPARYWLINGRRQIRFVRDDKRTQTTVETRELLDVSKRLRDMDQLGVDVQVIYPTLFLAEFNDQPELELALRRSYNRWLAGRTSQSGGRLRWVCLPPYMSIDKAIEELRFAKDHGACGVLKKGDREAGKWPVDQYFYPIYEEAEKLDLPICFHTGSGVPDFSPAREFFFSRFMRFAAPVPNAFDSLIHEGIPGKFPKLRFGFIEAGASWVPFVCYALKRQVEVQRRQAARAGGGTAGPFKRLELDLEQNLLKANRMYVACQVDEDLPYIVQYSGEDNLLVGSDYTHGDPADELYFPRLLRERARRGEISERLAEKILNDNPKAFYGL
jgi:predicted TIM-barrel fold metal-dependent hydrolase